ncbi:MAG: extracellular solute-binding protein [Chloroflexia bacterium]|nr:extracellular solute-binding protein [Chloroflexia bacterium]
MDRRRFITVTGGGAAGLALGGSLRAGPAFAAQGTTLEFWDTLNAETRLQVIEQLATSFGEQAGVTVQHRGWTLDELSSTLPRSVDSNQAPDIAQVNNGEALAGPMIRAGRLVSLAPYASQYGWDQQLPPALQARNMFNEDGTVFGEGQLWGVSIEAEIVGFYRNKSRFEENGVEVPTTFAELETAMQTLLDGGVTPLVFGNSDGWTAIHLFGNILGTMVSREYLDGLVYRSGDMSFEDDAMVNAATKFREWVDRGFLQEGFSGITSDDAAALFQAGEGAMLMQGSWQLPAVLEGLGESAGFFLTPPAEGGGTATPAATPSGAATPVAAATASVLHVGGVGIPYSIITGAQDPDVAAEFINSLISDEAVNTLLDAGVLAAAEVPADKIQAATVTGELYSAWNEALAGDAIGHYLDWASPTMYDTITAELQRLLAGETDPQAFAATLQQDYAQSFTA